MNSIDIMGRFTADPELKVTPKGKNVTSFCIAVPNSYDKDAEPYYIDCVAWEKRAETICKHFHKGKMIAISGELQTRKYEDNAGKTRKAVEVRVEKFFFCGDKDNKGTVKTAQKGAENTAAEVEDELPF